MNMRNHSLIANTVGSAFSHSLDQSLAPTPLPDDFNVTSYPTLSSWLTPSPLSVVPPPFSPPSPPVNQSFPPPCPPCSPPPFPPPPPIGESHLVLGSLAYTIYISGTIALILVAFFFFARLPGLWNRYESSRQSPANGSTGASSPLGKRLEALSFVLRTSEREVADLRGANTRDYLALQRHCLIGLCIYAVPALGVLLPINIVTGSFSQAVGFAKTTVTNIEGRDAYYLWPLAICTCFGAFAIEYIVRVIQSTLLVGRYADGDITDVTGSVAAYTLLLRNMPKHLVDSGASSLQELFSWQYPGKVLAAYIPRNRQAEEDALIRIMKARQKAECHRSKGQEDKVLEEQAVVQHFSAKLEEIRARPPRYADIAFVVFRDTFTTNRAYRDLKDLRVWGSRWGRGFFSGWHLPPFVERAPPPGGILWHNVSVTIWERQLRTLFVNLGVLLGLLFFSSPLALFGFMNDAANRMWHSDIQSEWHHWLSWAQAGARTPFPEEAPEWLDVPRGVQGSGAIAGLIFQFLPNLLVLLMMYAHLFPSPVTVPPPVPSQCTPSPLHHFCDTRLDDG
ncbi:hypothetical protein CYMTET_52999 [Cymbomonas tetramitiformis]|uniref:CSC1/OSCA1-like N-terminal transmembrane domain-containing protein n=1 Tax=Cymbomonas tetramitiformis TaxID=36881 RepID=A0AAE0EQ88_9CHLO|nr:hypothetical protein CYMTET_52999 [Cymbomonas tetramitiformis]